MTVMSNGNSLKHQLKSVLLELLSPTYRRKEINRQQQYKKFYTKNVEQTKKKRKHIQFNNHNAQTST